VRLRDFSRSVAALLLLAAASPASAQVVPEGPARALDGRLVVSAEAIATFGDRDSIAFFNYTGYEHNVLRLLRLGVSGVWRPIDRVAFVAEVRSENLEHPEAYAAYIRVRPWMSHKFDVQAGRIPPAFGSFGRFSYGADNVVIGYPLAYQYATPLRPDAVPATAADLLRMRARGWRSSFPIGSPLASAGVPLINGFQWDLGVQGHWTTGAFEVAAAVTNGTLSQPRVADDNGGKQVSTRIAVHPTVGLVLGASAATGSWLSRSVGPDHNRSQDALGFDVEYSRDYWLVRSEYIWSRWALPFVVTPATGDSVSADAFWVEGRYRLTPRLFAGARVDHLGFSRIRDAASLTATSWDAPVNRLEFCAGWYLQRNLNLRAAVQRNTRDGGRVSERTYFTGQLSYRF
jgi:hypothetical protein